MGALNWSQERIPFHGETLVAEVVRSPAVATLERELHMLRQSVTPKEAIFIRYPPGNRGEPVGFSPKGKPIFNPTYPDTELWRVHGISSFDSIRLVKAAFDAPSDESFRRDPASLDEIIQTLSKGFADGEFTLQHVNSAMLSFALTSPGMKVSRKQRALLDDLNERFFFPDATGKHMKSADLSGPDRFVIGAV